MSKDNKMAQSRSPKRDTSGAQKNPAPKCSGLDLLENIKTHSYEYTQTPGDEHLFLKALNQMRMEQMFTDLTVHVQVLIISCSYCSQGAINRHPVNTLFYFMYTVQRET